MWISTRYYETLFIPGRPQVERERGTMDRTGQLWCVPSPSPLLPLSYLSLPRMALTGLISCILRALLTLLRLYIYIHIHTGAIIMIYFFCFNVMELIYGSIVAPEFLDPVTAWVHHPMFCWIMVTGLTGNIIPFGNTFLHSVLIPILGSEHAISNYIQYTVLPYTSNELFSAPFLLSTIEELPTFILALGSVFPSLRSDIFFGSSFFMLRILFHSFLLYCCPLDSIKAVFIAMSMIMQLLWFAKWTKTYLPKLISGEKEKLN